MAAPPTGKISGKFHSISFGVPEIVGIVGGVATIASGRSFVRFKSESSTTDTVDTITMAGVEAGHVLLCEAYAGHTITFDDANINLGAATRALTDVGQFLTLVYNGAEWCEIAYVAGDNV